LRPDLEHYYLIDQYLENKLSGKELIAFENQLVQDKMLAIKIEEQRMLNNLILEAELKSVRTQIEKDLSAMQNPSFFRMYWKWIGAGLLSISAILYFTLPNSTDHANLLVQEPSVHAVENKNHSEIKAEDKTEKSAHTSQPVKATNATSKNATSKLNDAVVESEENSSINNAEVIVPTVSSFTNTSLTSGIETKPTEVTKTIDCSLTKITFSVATETACENTETGSIHIEKIAGGIAPYSYTINNKRIKERNTFELAAGRYEVKVSDKNGCSSEHNVTVLEKNCTPAIQQGMKFNINPTIGETCSIPFNTDKKGNVTIYNRGGKIIYRAANPSSDYIEWNGTDGYGGLAEAGLYVYIIEYTDGTKVTGEVNIIR
jgi:hypothetical protein